MLGVDRDVKEYTLHIQTQHVILGPDYRLEHVKVLVGCLTLDRGLVEAAEGVHDALLVLVRRSVNPSSGEELLGSHRKVLVGSDVSVLEKIFDRKIHICRVDEFRRRSFRRKGEPL